MQAFHQTANSTCSTFQGHCWSPFNMPKSDCHPTWLPRQFAVLRLQAELAIGWDISQWRNIVVYCSHLLRTESTTSRIQRIPSLSPSKTTPKLKYSHVVGSTPRPCDPGKLSPDLSCVRSCDISTTLGSRDIQARDPGKVSYDLPRDWSSMRSQVATQSPDRAHFRCVPSPLIGMWKTVGMINESMNKSQDLGAQ